jgi:predicted acylesterase/phospholipase RssA
MKRDISSVHRSPFLLITVWFFVGLWLAGCAAKRPHPHPQPLPGDRTEMPKPGADPTAKIEPPSPFTPAQPNVPPKKETPSLALVLGGAGIASFATVGLLKRFHEEGIKIDYIVTTGWPSLFVVANGFLRSVHDVEWFAMRLQDRDFKGLASFEKDDEVDRGRISSLLQNTFQGKSLSQVSTPVIVSAKNTDLGKPETFESGEWEFPLMKTMSIPGLYREYPTTDDLTAQAIDVEEALRRGAKVVVAVEMYDDYIGLVKKGKKPLKDEPARKLYLTRLQSQLGSQMRTATVTGKIVLKEDPLAFGAKRRAIYLGYREGTRLARQLRSILSAHYPTTIDLSIKAE